MLRQSPRGALMVAPDRPSRAPPRRSLENAEHAPGRGRYGVDPAQVPDFIALRGDASDRIPGAKRVGPKTASALIRQYGSLDKLLAAGRFAAQAGDLRLYRSIATMNRKAPLPSLKSQTPTWPRASALAREWELNRLADRLAGLGRSAN